MGTSEGHSSLHASVRGTRPRSAPTSSIDIALSRSSATALFVQVREQIRSLIQRGILLPGVRLPPVRVLASALQVNQITVARAYRELVQAGLLEGRRGGGSFVRAFTPQRSQPEEVERAPSQPMMADRLYELARAPGVISFSSNYARIDTAGLAAFKACMLEALDEDHLASSMQYELPAGRPEVRAEIARFLLSEGLNIDAADLLITSGAQQAIDLAVRAMCTTGSPVIIEQPAYYGAINAFRLMRVRLSEIPDDRDGPDLDALEDSLTRTKARVIYLNPTFQNPTGITITAERRAAILALAASHDAIIIEDDHASDLRFRGTAIPPIRALPGAEHRVIYIRSFGKTIMPGMRLGFMVCPPQLLQRMLLMKANADLHSNSLSQLALAQFLKRGMHGPLVERLRRTYGERQDALYAALHAGLPAGCKLERPDGGLSLWLTLPYDIDTSELYFRAVRRGVAFVDGSVFYASAPKTRSMRLSFGLVDDEQLMEGASRLCSVVNDLQMGVRSRGLLLT